MSELELSNCARSQDPLGGELGMNGLPDDHSGQHFNVLSFPTLGQGSSQPGEQVLERSSRVSQAFLSPTHPVTSASLSESHRQGAQESQVLPQKPCLGP